LLALLALLGPARGQEAIVYQPEGAAGQIAAAPEGALTSTSGPLFLSQLPPRPVSGHAAGTVAGLGFTNLGDILIGFDYLRPFWTHRDFTLAVPSGSLGSFPLLGDIGHVDNSFAFVPKLVYNYHLTDYDFGISASGTFLDLNGRLQRGVATAGGATGDLTANSSLTIVVANLLEVTHEAYYTDMFGKKHTPGCLEDLVVDLTLGTRYSSVSQNYTGSLTNGLPGAGANVSTRYSSQSFRGVGLTGSAGLALPLGEDWVLFSNTRGSLLVGDNRKDSTLTVSVAGQPGVSSNINQTKTAWIPVAECEAGVEWGMRLAQKLRAGDPQPLLTVRVAAVGQFWGDVGPLSAGSSQGFHTSNLFLVGASVMVGIHH
jgi:hypothetical protein